MIKEVRFCENCKKWLPKEKTEVVSVGSTYHTKYSGVEAHPKHATMLTLLSATTLDMCKKCLEEIYKDKQND